MCSILDSRENSDLVPRSTGGRRRGGQPRPETAINYTGTPTASRLRWFGRPFPATSEIMSSPTADPIVIPIVHVAPASPAPVVVPAAPPSRALLLAWGAVVMCRLVLAGMGPAFKFMQSFHIAAARAAFWYV